MQYPYDIGFYGNGTPKIAIYGFDGAAMTATVSPCIVPNRQEGHWNLAIPAEEWGWCLAFENRPGTKATVILCDYKGNEKYDPDPLEDAPEEFRAMIGNCRPFYRRRAILSSAQWHTLSGVSEVAE